VLAAVSAGHSLLWLAVDDEARVHGAGVTELDGDVCVIAAWGSDDQGSCGPLLATIEQFAKAEGCKAVRIYGRAGWQRRLTEYRVKAIIMERPL
jgi:GNAT superfamily N-acetyltransferase